MPEPFLNMAPTNPLPGVYPIAIYRYRTNTNGIGGEIAYDNVGVIIHSGPDSWDAILPEHTFTMMTNAYAVRIMRPDTGTIFGFINNVTLSDDAWLSREIAIASISNKPVDIAPLARGRRESDSFFYASETVEVGKKVVSHMYSDITGAEVKILGYGMNADSNYYVQLKLQGSNFLKPVTITDAHPSVVVEYPGKKGWSGSPFYDEYGRLFFLNAGPDKERSAILVKQISDYCVKRYGREPKGISFLVGPMSLESRPQ